MKYIKSYALLCAALFVTSCGGSNPEATSGAINYTLEIGENKVFPLDDETAFDRIDGKYVAFDGMEYYTFLHRDNHSLYFYDYNTAEVAHITQMDKQGPNAVEIPYYYLELMVQDFDHIFVNTLKFFYRINKEAQVLEKYTENGNTWNDPDIHLDKASVYKNGKFNLGMGITVPAKGDTNFLRAVFDFESGQIEEKYIDERILVKEYETKRDRLEEMAKSGGVMNMNIDFVGNDQRLIAGTAIGDSLYIFENYELVGAYYAGDPQVATTDLDGWFDKTKVETFEGGGVSMGPNPVQPAYYIGLLLSADGQQVYRIFIHGTREVLREGDEEEVPEVIGASLIVFDLATKTSSSLPLPVDDLEISYYSSDTFVTPDGILFPVKEVESESEKVYRVLKVKKESE